jgi:hypothetical protein
MPAEVVRLRIANLRKAVLVTGQAYQEPKDALNEFVSNAVDEYVEHDLAGARITIHLRRRGTRPVVAVVDDGRGMSPNRLREIARNLFDSRKAGDERTLGEKAIGILAFQQLGAKCDVVSRAEASDETWKLTLRRGEATAELAPDRRRPRQLPGTTVYISDLDPEVLRVLTLRKVVDYMRIRRGPALTRGDYEIEVTEGEKAELVTPERPDGIRLSISPRITLWGRLDFALWVAPRQEGRRRRVAVVGRTGTTIVDDIAEIEDFAGPPWTGDQVAGSISFPSLQQTSGRRAVLRDRDVFPVFLDTVRSIEPTVLAAVERITLEVDRQTSERVADQVRRLFGRLLRELEDLANPMRTPVGDESGDGASAPEPLEIDPSPALERSDEFPVLSSLNPGGLPRPRNALTWNGPAFPSGRFTRLPNLAPDPEPSELRSRFDAAAGFIYYNTAHADYLMVKDKEPLLLEYLAYLVAKEYVVYNNPRAPAGQVAEELVRVLILLRRHVGAPMRASRVERERHARG